MKPRMFIASSAEHLDVAYAAQEVLERDVEATVWTQSVFLPSRSVMASLVEALDEADFGLFILTPADVTSIREVKVQTVRDNVVFELGLFVGRLGSERCFMIVPRGVEDLHLPTDLLGIIPAMYDADRQDRNLVAALGPACNRVRKMTTNLGLFKATRVAEEPPPSEAVPSQLFGDPEDCISIIESWMGHRPSGENSQVIHYVEVDRILKLQPGSARLHIEKAAARWGYRTVRKGKDTIIFTDREDSTPYY